MYLISMCKWDDSLFVFLNVVSLLSASASFYFAAAAFLVAFILFLKKVNFALLENPFCLPIFIEKGGTKKKEDFLWWFGVLFLPRHGTHTTGYTDSLKFACKK